MIEHMLAHPGHIVINGQPYQLDANPRSNPPGQMGWEEEPIIRGQAPASAPGLKHTQISENSWISEQVIDTWHLGMGDAIRYEHGTYHYGEDVDASQEGSVILAPLRTNLAIGVSPGGVVDPAGFFEQGGRLYLEWGRYIRQIDTPSTTPADTADVDLGAGNFVQDVALFNDVAIIAMGNADVFQTRTSGAAPGTYASAAAGLTADYVTTNEQFLYRYDSDTSPHRVYACLQGDDPTLAASWSAGIQVGGRNDLPTDLSSFGFQVMIGRVDGVFRTNRQGFTPNILEEFADQRSLQNAIHMAQFSGAFYIPANKAFYRYDGQQPIHVGPYLLGGLGPVHGTYWATAKAGEWLYVALNDGSSGADTYILRYKEINTGEGKRGIWHTFTTWADNRVTGLHASSITATSGLSWYSIWAASANTDNISRWKLAPKTATPLQDVNDPQTIYTYAASGILYMPRLYLGSFENTKTFLDVTIEGDDLLASNETIAFAYRTTGAIPWSTSSPAFTTLVTASSSPTTTALNVSGLFIEPRITLARGATTTVTPILRRIRIRALQTINNYRHVKCRIIVPADTESLPSSTDAYVDDSTPETSYAALRALSPSTAVTVLDPWGVSRSMYVVDSSLHVVPLDNADDPQTEPRFVAELHLVQAPS